MIGEFKGRYRFLSNFWPCGVMLGSNYYPSVEHAYQAAKTKNDTERILIRAAKSAGEAKRMGRFVTMRPDWEEVKLDVMLHLLRQKFTQEPLRTGLLATGDMKLVEGNTWGDTFWGVCRGTGKNHLGRLLMQVRSEISNTKENNE